MNSTKITKRLNDIKQAQDDDEVAHSLEKDLWEEALIAIANGAENSKELATLALKTTHIHFNRWFS